MSEERDKKLAELLYLFHQLTPAQRARQLRRMRAFVAVQNGTATPAQKSYVTRVRSRRAEAQKGA